jgi:predicted nucleic acid-binding protein
MKAVSNTTPLRYLIAIEQEHLLGQLFEKVYVPVAVHAGGLPFVTKGGAVVTPPLPQTIPQNSRGNGKTK